MIKRAIIIMGVSGSGKTTIGEKLSEEISCPFYDGDDFHPPENVDKMASGKPLTDQDRQPWLESLHRLIQSHFITNQSLIIACSALKESYREILLGKEKNRVDFVYLKGTFDTIFQRMVSRDEHYMKPEMLRSQFEALEEPEQALVIDITKPVDQITNQIITKLQLSKGSDI